MPLEFVPHVFVTWLIMIFPWNRMFCSLVHVLVKTKARPSMVGKLIFKIKALSFKVFIKYFKFIKFVVFIFFLTDVFFYFQFCEYRILDFMEVEHSVLKQSLSINIIFYMKHTKVQYSYSFSGTYTLWSEDDSFHIWECWKINIVIITAFLLGWNFFRTICPGCQRSTGHLQFLEDNFSWTIDWNLKVRLIVVRKHCTLMAKWRKCLTQVVYC